MRLLILLLALAAALTTGTRSPSARGRSIPGVTTGSGIKGYPALRARVERDRRVLARALRVARTPAARRAVLDRAGARLVAAVADDLGRAWLGTPWAFHGASETPGQGAIACGYLVTTLLRDAGLRVERARLAQRPSEAILRSLVAPAAIRRHSDVPLDRFLADVRAGGDGLLGVGLDFHVGFLVVRGRRVTFLHSNYLTPRVVVAEDAASSAALRSSRYRVTGRLSGDEGLVTAWLQGRVLPTR